MKKIRSNRFLSSKGPNVFISKYQGLIEILVVLIVSIPIGFPIGVLLSDLIESGSLTGTLVFTILILVLSVFLTIQGIFTLCWMLYSWEDPVSTKKHRSPENYLSPHLSFTALVPARHEEEVIQETIKTINNISYPSHLKEILVLCRIDDIRTIQKVEETMKELQNHNIHLITFDGFPINKPRALNEGLKFAKNEIITIFDAEDEPHNDIYNIVNTVLVDDNADVVQSGVQLMNFKSSWFSALNCLEYYFWFKSGLHFFLRTGKIAPLGGNTIFIRKYFLKHIGGWDESCLTEDAEIAVRLSLIKAKVRVVYDEEHVTKEEAPETIKAFIKQRTRWDQGFLQIYFGKNLSVLPKLSQRLVMTYILLSPEVQAILLLYTPFAIWIALFSKVSLLISLFSFIPLILFFLQLVLLIIGLFEFTRAYKLKFPIYMPFLIVISFYPYQFLLMISALRALYRFVFSQNTWEKTLHTNAHRT